MNIRSIRHARAIALGGGDSLRYSVSADLAAGDDADECAVQLAAVVYGWLHDQLTAYYAGEDLPREARAHARREAREP